MQSLVQDAVDEIKEQISNDAQSAVATAQLDLYRRLLDNVARMSERLREPDSIFRDSLVDNLKELCELLPKLDLIGDQTLTDTLARVQGELCKYAPETLRVNVSARTATQVRAEALENDLKMILGV